MVHDSSEPIVEAAPLDAAATVADDPTGPSGAGGRRVAGSLRAGLRRGAGQGLKAAAAAVDLVRRRPGGLTVLLYHQVGGARPSAVNLSAGRFDEQLAYLRAQQAVGTLDEGVAAIEPNGPPIENPPRFVVTFDDGTADFVDVALPLIERHQIPVTLYVATRWVDEAQSFWDDGTILSWSALRDALATGLVTIGSHTHSHALLDRLPAKDIADELDRSIGLIQDNLGVTPEHFAYPKALAPSSSADAAVRARFRSAALAGTRPNPYGVTDPYLLTRSPIQVSDGMLWFRRKAAGGLRLEDDLREVLNRRRYAGSTR